MPVWIVEVESALVIPGVNLVELAPAGVDPIGKVPLTNLFEDFVEFDLAQQEGVVLRPDFAVGSLYSLIFVADPHYRKRADP
jgi:hypothetical protein